MVRKGCKKVFGTREQKRFAAVQNGVAPVQNMQTLAPCPKGPFVPFPNYFFLVDVSEMFYFSALRRGRGSLRLQEEGGVLLLKISSQERGGHRGAERVSAGNVEGGGG